MSFSLVKHEAIFKKKPNDFLKCSFTSLYIIVYGIKIFNRETAKQKIIKI